MKDISEISNVLGDFNKKLITHLIEEEKQTAKKIQKDVKELAPGKKGTYQDSIKVSDTTYKNGVIKTNIFTDLKSEDNHFIGRMIENGTGIYALEPHIGHTKAFIESHYHYWYVPVTSINRAIGKKIVINGKEFYIARPQKPKPHWKPAYNKNIDYRKEQIRKAVRGK